jgi:hypothetical protein
MKITLLVLACFCCLLTGCQQTMTVQGHWARSFESSNFVPCGHLDNKGHLGWWLEGNADFNERYCRIQTAIPNPGALPEVYGPEVYIRLHGIRYGPGRYGHLGAWKYRFVVDEVLEMRPSTSNDCR